MSVLRDDASALTKTYPVALGESYPHLEQDCGSKRHHPRRVRVQLFAWDASGSISSAPTGACCCWKCEERGYRAVATLESVAEVLKVFLAGCLRRRQDRLADWLWHLLRPGIRGGDDWRDGPGSGSTGRSSELSRATDPQYLDQQPDRFSRGLYATGDNWRLAGLQTAGHLQLDIWHPARLGQRGSSSMPLTSATWRITSSTRAASISTP